MTRSIDLIRIRPLVAGLVLAFSSLSPAFAGDRGSAAADPAVRAGGQQALHAIREDIRQDLRDRLHHAGAWQRVGHDSIATITADDEEILPKVETDAAGSAYDPVHG